MATAKSKNSRNSNGEGCVYVHKWDNNERDEDGKRLGKPIRWAGYATLPNGKPKYVYGKTRKEVTAKLNELKDSLKSGVVPRGKVTVAQWLDEWMRVFVEDGKKTPKTEEGYRQHIQNYIVPAIGHIKLNQLISDDVQAMLDGLRTIGGLKGKPLSLSSVHGTRRVLRAALNRAKSKGYVVSNAAEDVSLPAEIKIHRPVLEHASGNTFLGSIKGDWLEPLYYIGLFLGLRIGEVLGLRWADVDLKRHTLRVEQKVQRVNHHLIVGPPKTGRSRELALPIRVEKTLIRHRELQHAARSMAENWQDNDLVFPTTIGTAIDPRNVLREFKAHLQRAGLPDMRFHDLRHSCGTILVQEKVHPRIIMEILGHTRISTTMDIYTQVSADAQRSTADMMDTFYTEEESE